MGSGFRLTITVSACFAGDRRMGITIFFEEPGSFFRGRVIVGSGRVGLAKEAALTVWSSRWELGVQDLTGGRSTRLAGSHFLIWGKGLDGFCCVDGLLLARMVPWESAEEMGGAIFACLLIFAGMLALEPFFSSCLVSGMIGGSLSVSSFLTADLPALEMGTMGTWAAREFGSSVPVRPSAMLQSHDIEE